jgi:hypothetical protein
MVARPRCAEPAAAYLGTMNEPIDQPLPPPRSTFIRCFTAKRPEDIERAINEQLAARPELTVRDLTMQAYLNDWWLRRFSASVVFEARS